MTKQVEKLLDLLNSKAYKSYRVKDVEEPILYPDDFFGFHRGTNTRCDFRAGNLTPNYGRIITDGFDSVRQQIETAISATDDAEKQAFGKDMLDKLEHCLSVCHHFRETVKEQGNKRLYNALLKIPEQGAQTFFEACVFLNLCIYFFRVDDGSHIGLGRFDQYDEPVLLPSVWLCQ